MESSCIIFYIFVCLHTYKYNFLFCPPLKCHRCIVQTPCRCAICQWERAQTHVHIVIICVFGSMYYDLGKNRCLQKGNHHWACDARGIATSWQLWIWTPRRKPWNLGMTKHTEWFEGNVNPWIMIQNPQCCLIAGSTFRINWYQLITFVGIRVNETDNDFFYSRLAIIGFWVVFGVQKRCKGITRWAPLSHHSSQKRWFKDLDIWKLQMNDRGLGGLRASPLLPRFCLSWKWIVGPLSTRSPKIQVGYSYPNWKAKEQRELVRTVRPSL